MVDQQGYDGVSKVGVALDLVRQRMTGAHHDPRQPRGVEQALFLIEVPTPRLLGEKTPLKAIGEAGDDIRKSRHLLVEVGTEARQLLLVAQLTGLDDLVEARRECLVVGRRRQVPVASAG